MSNVQLRPAAVRLAAQNKQLFFFLFIFFSFFFFFFFFGASVPDPPARTFCKTVVASLRKTSSTHSPVTALVSRNIRSFSNANLTKTKTKQRRASEQAPWVVSCTLGLRLR